MSHSCEGKGWKGQDFERITMWTGTWRMDLRVLSTLCGIRHRAVEACCKFSEWPLKMTTHSVEHVTHMLEILKEWSLEDLPTTVFSTNPALRWISRGSVAMERILIDYLPQLCPPPGSTYRIVTITSTDNTPPSLRQSNSQPQQNEDVVVTRDISFYRLRLRRVHG